MAQKPERNILLITADQWRGECLSARGHPCVKTPNFDALSADGLMFKNHYAVCAPCGPSRASLMSGMYLQNHRSCQNGSPLDERHTNIALEARAGGYDPVLFGYTDTSRDPRHTSPGELMQQAYEGVLPGFRAETLLTESLEPWIEDLKSKGYDISENARDIYAHVADYPDAENHGRTFPPPRYSADDSITAFLTNQVKRYLTGRGEGWFVHTSYLRPHPPFIAPEPYNSMYDASVVPAPIRAPSPGQEAGVHPWMACALDKMGDCFDPWKQSSIEDTDYERDILQTRATYYGLITKVDHYAGKLIQHLKETGAYDTTLIIVTSDHGELLGDRWLFGKRGYFDEGYHIPLIIRDPRKAADATRGTAVTAYSEAVDIMPTILDWLEIDIPRQCDGASLLPFCEGGEPDGWRQEIHWEYDVRDVADSRVEKELGITMDQCVLNVIRDEEYKYVHFAALPPLFFDRKNDPLEQRNLADDPAYAPQMLKYAAKLLSWRMENDERTLTGMKLTSDGIIARS